MIQIAQEKMPNARFYEFDFTKGLPDELLTEKFDYVICTYAIHHIDRQHKINLLSLLKGVLNANGEILIGDVIFQSQADMDSCIASSGDEWDDEEVYIVVDELMNDCDMDVQFIKCSYCSGVCALLLTGPRFSGYHEAFQVRFQQDTRGAFHALPCPSALKQNPCHT